MAISVGSELPEATLFHIGEDGPSPLSIRDFAAGRKVVLFAVPGAFTPTCHMNHLPGFVEHEAEIKSKGVDEIAVISVNDVFVMDAWANVSGAEGKIKFISDPNAEFAKAMGLELDLTARGLGVRSMRYAMIVEDGKVSLLNVDDKPGDADGSSAATILAAL